MAFVDLPYDRGRCQAHAPESWSMRFLHSPEFPDAGTPEDRVRLALRHPVDGEGLKGFLTAGQRLTLIVPDKTRRCGLESILPILLEEILATGIHERDITILFANGTHPRMSTDEEEALLGPGIRSRVTVLQHDSRDSSSLIAMGTTRRGTPVVLNRHAIEADRLLLVGGVVYHYFAGFGGGPKLVLPGVAAYESAVANHRLTLTEKGTFHPRCRDGVLEGNPVAEDLREAMRFVPPSHHLCVVNDPIGNIVACWFGSVDAVHHHACRETEARYRVELPEAADCTIVSAGGYPRDINFIQAHKTLQHASYGTKEGGSIIAAAACRDGMGNATFLSWFTEGEFDTLRTRVLSGYSMNAHTAIAMMEKAERFSIYLLSDLPEQAVRRMGMIPVSSLQEAIDLVAVRSHTALRCQVIEQGNILMPQCVEPHRETV